MGHSYLAHLSPLLAREEGMSMRHKPRWFFGLAAAPFLMGATAILTVTEVEAQGPNLANIDTGGEFLGREVNRSERSAMIGPLHRGRLV